MRVGADRVDVLGFSAGDLVAQRLVLAALERERRLVVVFTVSYRCCLMHLTVGGSARSGSRKVQLLLGAGCGAEVKRADAVAFAPINVWRQEFLADYLQRVSRIQSTS